MYKDQGPKCLGRERAVGGCRCQEWKSKGNELDLKCLSGTCVTTADLLTQESQYKFGDKVNINRSFTYSRKLLGSVIRRSPAFKSLKTCE